MCTTSMEDDKTLTPTVTILSPWPAPAAPHRNLSITLCPLSSHEQLSSTHSHEDSPIHRALHRLPLPSTSLLGIYVTAPYLGHT